MFLTYNIIQLLALLLLWPVLVLWALSPRHRGRIAARLGAGLPKLGKSKGGPRIWIHALSMGEAASALPLITAIRRDIPQAEIIFSTTTRGGSQYARHLADKVDYQVAFPFDFYWLVKRFIKRLNPDLFILIETDFWPNILGQMWAMGIPAILANGRITANSFKNYRRASFIFRPLFNSFSFLSMQMEADAGRMIDLGVPPAKVGCCGNLKYDLQPFNGPKNRAARREDFNLPETGLILVAGSTHRGEEEIIINSYITLAAKYKLALVIAPRDTGRGAEIAAMLQRRGLNCARRSQRNTGPTSILVLDTLGELIRVYSLADLAFVGGSLVPQGGHNPVEPASLGRAVIFGPHMEDFAEISRDLCQNQAALGVSADNFTTVCANLLADKNQRREMGERAARFILTNQGAAGRYIEIIKKIIHA
ncbi:MAG: 3-deoxy-D-manno-octulosonic acid transferase [Deltaproteobacteria bacterium]|nr:3-deoxy-D-manno-octulosonic acid transferase [Deltaproteobacteria bacterium]